MTEEAKTYELVKPKPSSEALVEVEQQRAIAETQGAMIIAKRFPRDTISAMDRIVNACTRPGLAEAALYEYSRGGTDITGPSIRLAEAIAQNWGNLQFGIREMEQRNGVSTVEAFAWDIETNTREIKIFQVAHKRYTKKGTYSLEDPRDIYEMVANQGARRLRSCILGIIPGDVVESAVKQCESTLKTKAAVTPERIASLLDKFSEFKVTKEQIETRIQRHIEAMTPAQMVNLGKIYNSLKDGMSSPMDWFEVAEQQQDDVKSKIDSLKDKLKGGEPGPTNPQSRQDTTVTDPPQPIKCPKCGVDCASERGLKKHLTQSHTIKQEPPNQVEAETSQSDKAKDPGEPKKTAPPPLVDWETGEEAEAKSEDTEDWFVTEAENYRELLSVSTWEQIMKLYGMTGKDIATLAFGYREAFLTRCKAQLDKQNAAK